MSAISISSAFASANRGPLTTIFTPPASCLSETTLVSFLTTVSPTSSGFTTTKIFINHFSWGDAACYPSTIATISGSTRWNNGYYYSPGVCPSGWTSACQAQTNAFGFSTTLSSETSAVLCCPSNWDCVQGSTVLANHGCSTALVSGQTLTSVWPAPAPTPNVAMNLPSQRSLTNWVVPINTTAVCDAIPVLWQNTDIQILSLLGEQITQSTPSPTTTTSISSSSSNSIPSATNTPNTTGTPSSTAPPIAATGLSTGAKTAIGVTIPVFLLALILGIFLFFRRRNRRDYTTHHELPASADSSNWTRLDMLKNVDVKTGASELDSSMKFEANVEREIQELADGSREYEVFELPGNEGELRMDKKKDLGIGGDERTIKRREVGVPQIPTSKFSAS